MTSYQIRRAGASESDVADIVALRASMGRARGAPQEDGFAGRVAQWWAEQASSRRVWLASDGDRPVGMVNLKLFERMPMPGEAPSSWAYVANVWVEPADRRRGVATGLMSEALAWCRDARLRRVVLNPSEMSLPLYARLGFRPASDLLRLDLAAGGLADEG